MNQTIEIITPTRLALVDVIRRFIQGLEPAFLKDPSQPVLVAIDGPFACGKSLVPDAACAELFGPGKGGNSSLACRGQETWRGSAYQEEIDVCFMNAHASEIDPFLSARARGGISFISNSDDGHTQQDFYKDTAGVRIWLSPPGKAPWDTQREGWNKAANSNLAKQFNTVTGEWARYVQIEVKDERLLSSPRFRQAINAIDANRSATGIYQGDPTLKTPQDFCR